MKDLRIEQVACYHDCPWALKLTQAEAKSLDSPRSMYKRFSEEALNLFFRNFEVRHLKSKTASVNCFLDLWTKEIRDLRLQSVGIRRFRKVIDSIDLEFTDGFAGLDISCLLKELDVELHGILDFVGEDRNGKRREIFIFKQAVPELYVSFVKSCLPDITSEPARLITLNVIDTYSGQISKINLGSVNDRMDAIKALVHQILREEYYPRKNCRWCSFSGCCDRK